jgi:outer membrane lipoprotein carrier protein
VREAAPPVPRPARLNVARRCSSDILPAMTALLALALAAAAPDPQALAAKVQAYYERTRDLEARFSQAYTYSGFGRKQVSSGRFQVKKPGKLRWDYEKPEAKVVVVNGSRLVQWEPEANQAYVDEHFDATAMSAAVSFLLGEGKLAAEFQLATDDAGHLLLTPKKPDPRVESIALTVGPNGEVTASRVIDGSGNVNEVTFADLKRNAGLPDARFELQLPKDAHRVAAPAAR